jgi:hypothetical protein
MEGEREKEIKMERRKKKEFLTARHREKIRKNK